MSALSSPARTSRRGFTVVEALVALLIGWLVGALALGTFARQRVVQANLAHRGEALAALRTARYVLGRELRGGDGTEAVGVDTLGLRAFRGIGMICPDDDGRDGEVRVRVEGVRAPDPEKDSVWVLGGDGTSQVLALVAREEVALPCAPAPREPVEMWRLSGTLPVGAVFVRYFEHGSYHLAGGALRYRRGRAGRQPLTPEVLRTPPSGFQDDEASVHVDLYPLDGAPRAVLLRKAGAHAPGG